MTPVSSRGAAPKTDDVERGRGPAGLDLDVVPVDEAADAGLHDQPDPGAVLGAEVAEPRQVGRHPGRRRRAERPGRVAQRLGRAASCEGGMVRL